MLLASSLTLNTCVYVNVDPYCGDTVPPYHPENSVPTCAVTLGVLICAPATPMNWKLACVTSRVFENPWIATVSWFPFRVSVAVDTLGAAAGMTMATGCSVAGVTLVPPAVSTTGIVIVPATVPDCSWIGGTAVEFAGTVKVNVRPPPANWIEGSSVAGVTAEAKFRLKVAVKAVG